MELYTRDDMHEAFKEGFAFGADLIPDGKENDDEFEEFMNRKFKSIKPNIPMGEMKSAVIKEIASHAWNAAANSFRMYPNNKHTFSEYWSRTENLFNDLYAFQFTPQRQEQKGVETVEEMLEFADKIINNIDTREYSDYDVNQYKLLRKNLDHAQFQTKQRQEECMDCDRCVFKVNYDKFHDARVLFEKARQEITDEVSSKVAKLIIQIRDLFIEAKDTPLDTMEEIWHLLYQIASPNYDKLCDDVWTEIEEIAHRVGAREQGKGIDLREEQK